MKFLPLGVCLLLMPLGGVWAQGTSAVPPVSASESRMETLKQPRDFEQADLREALAYLSEQANVTLVLKKDVRGTFSLKIDEPVVPFEALRRIADQLHLLIEKKTRDYSTNQEDRTYLIWTKADFKPSAGAAEPELEPAAPADGFSAMGATVGSTVTNMVIKMDTDMATYLAKPETAAKRAKFYKNLYEALIKEGFRSEDALKLTLATAYPSLSDDKATGNK